VVARWKLCRRQMWGGIRLDSVAVFALSDSFTVYQPTQCTEMCLHYLGHPKYPPLGTAEGRNLVCQLPLGNHGHPNPQRRDTFIVFFAFQTRSMEVVAIYSIQTLGYEEVQVRLAGWSLEVGNRSPRLH